MDVVKAEISTKIIENASKVFAHKGYKNTRIKLFAYSLGMGKR